MKSTYKLFGTFWDGVESNELSFPEYIHKPDFEMVSLRSLLCASNENDVSCILAPFCNSKMLVINYDYTLVTSNPVLKTFIEKRIRQIEVYLSRKYDTVFSFHEYDKKIPSGATNAQRNQS